MWPSSALQRGCSNTGRSEGISVLNQSIEPWAHHSPLFFFYFSPFCLSLTESMSRSLFVFCVPVSIKRHRNVLLESTRGQYRSHFRGNSRNPSILSFIYHFALSVCTEGEWERVPLTRAHASCLGTDLNINIINARIISNLSYFRWGLNCWNYAS